MSRKKSKTVAKNTINECHLAEAIENNRLSRELKISHKEFSKKQKEFIDIALDEETKMIFIPGPAGCAKTYVSVYCGLQLINAQRVSELVYIRSAVESADHKLGFLPGAQDDKMAPYLEPFKDKLEEFLSPVDVRYLQGEERIYGIPVGFLRGASWEDKFILVDEAQNLTEKEIITTITRIGENTKVFICGDSMQSDIGNKSGFTNIAKIFSDEESIKHGIRYFEFNEDDIVRSQLVKFIVKKIKSLK
jgi:phosphate starvation-inducible PhoH-like protein